MKLFSLFSSLDLKTADFEKKLNSASIKAAQFQHKLQNAMSAAAKTTAAVTAAIGSVVTALGAKLTTTGFVYNTQIENYTANFRSLLGSVEAAEQRVEELKQKAATTPFGLADLADATQTLLSFQVDASKTNDILSQLGDIALGNKEKLSSLALVFGQVSSAGKLTGQDLMQFINAGFNPLNAIIERTGESMEQVRNRMSAGKIGIDEVMQAIHDVTSEGGLFYGGTEQAAQTTTGLWSTFTDNWTEFWGKAMQPVNEAAQQTVLPSLISNLDKLSNKLFGVKKAEEQLFLDSEGNAIDPSQNLRTWLSDLMSVWTDGKEEDDAIVDGFVTGFKENTTAIQNALVERIQSGALSDEEFAQAQRDLEEISRIQGEVERLLQKRQNGMITPEEEQQLGQMVLALETMQTKLGATQSTDRVLSPWEKFINAVSNLAVEKLDSITDWLIQVAENGTVGTFFEDVANTFSTISNALDKIKAFDEWYRGTANGENIVKAFATGLGLEINEEGKFVEKGLDEFYQKYPEYSIEPAGKEQNITVADLVPAPSLEWFNSNGSVTINDTDVFASKIAAATAEALRNSPIQVETDINIDGETIASATFKQNAKKQQAYNRAVAYGTGSY